MAIPRTSSRPALAALAFAGVLLVNACGTDDAGRDEGAVGPGPGPAGAPPAAGGGTLPVTGGIDGGGSAAGGAVSGGGGSSGSSPLETGGRAAGGVVTTGGAATGGATTGGVTTGGVTTGGVTTGGVTTGGVTTGGVTTGGVTTGGVTTGGVTTGGVTTGGVTTGGAGGAGAGVGGGAGAGRGGAGGEAPAVGLGWPIDCVLGVDCQVGYPDTDGDGVAFDCDAPGYTGHQGTDISIDWAAMDAGTDVVAADDGEVLWVFDGHYDRCPDAAQPDCAEPALDMGPGVQSGYLVCTDARDEYCVGTSYTTDCFFCFAGANVVVIRHPAGSVAFATRYDHLRNGSIVVEPGQIVRRGDKIAEVGSAGNSTGPHLHFEVWVGGYYVLADPWAGPCGPNLGPSLWDSSLGLDAVAGASG